MSTTELRIRRRIERRRQRAEGLAQFQADVAALLRRPWIPLRGKTVPLADYLAFCEQEGSPEGDEQPVVDQLVRDLLRALGYRDADISYNRALPGPGGRAVPDFVLRVDEFLPSAPVLVIEDKATSIRDLRARVRRGSGGESPLDQLRRYARSGAVYGRAGLLCNGWTLEAWHFGAEGDARVVHLDLHGFARHALEHPDTHVPEPFAGALGALWTRFSRAAFTDAHADNRELFETPALTTDRIQRLNQAFASTRDTAVYEGILGEHLEEAWRAQAIDVADAADLLVDVLRVLIDDFAEDVRHQLDDALSRHRTYLDAERRAISEGSLEILRKKLPLFAPRFDLPPDELASRYTQPLEAWASAARPGEARGLVARILRDLGPHVRTAAEDTAVQAAIPGLDPAARPPRARAKGVPERVRRDVLGQLEQVLFDFCDQTISATAQRDQLREQHRLSIRAADAFNAWAQRVSSSVMVGASDETLRAEFARQTAYVYVVRLLLVRICEDKGLFKRKLSNGGLVLWEEQAGRYLDYASGRSYEYLTRMAYECAQNVYTHFYGASEVFDWYRMDEKTLIRALLMLNAFNLARVDTDIIGTVYGRYLLEGKHEQGRYYTPRPLVTAMLDMLGYQGGSIVGRRLLDLACGSGSFLVEACRRLLDRFRGPDGEIPAAQIEPALREVQGALWGFDINPFACYLAETNLLIQVLDLVRRAQDEGLSFLVERFAVHCTDSLLVHEDLAVLPGTAWALFKPDEADAELIKARAEPHADGFDFLIGNPPYVRADEDSPRYLDYRGRLQAQAWFTTQHKKWDLYVPFVEQYHRLLAAEGRACLVTIESLSSAPYAMKLRELLARRTTLHEVLFTEDLRLFADAEWQDNIVFCFSAAEPPEGHTVRRVRARGRDAHGNLQVEPLDMLIQQSAESDRLFNKRPEVGLDLARTVRWDELCYVSVGMVLNSDEMLSDGDIVAVAAAYDPARFGERLVEDLGARGKRVAHRSFGRDDLIADAPDDIHTRPYVGSREVLRGGVGRRRWLEHGAHTRSPARVRRPTFPELYDRPKIMFGAFTGVAVDEGSDEGFLMVPDTVRLGVRWCDLTEVRNRSLAEARRQLTDANRYHPDLSADISLWYLCALALSEPVQRWLHANKRSMKEHVYPEDIKAIPVKIIPPEEQQPFIALCQERHRLWGELTALEAEGFRIGARIEIPIHMLVGRYRKEHARRRWLTLVQAQAAGLFHLDPAFMGEDLRRARASGDTVVIGRAVVARLGDAVREREATARVLGRILSSLPASFDERQSIDEIPTTEAGLLELGKWLDQQEAGVAARQDRIKAIDEELDRMAWALYRPAAAPAP